MDRIVKSATQVPSQRAVPRERKRSRANRKSCRVGSWNPVNDDSPNATDDAADEIMDRIVKSATQVPSQRAVPRERKRSRANRKSCKSGNFHHRFRWISDSNTRAFRVVI
ncbi:UNVERIFIED_CONTAM: hypothetical protein FKN15_065040 [Acipenser sinensis]